MFMISKRKYEAVYKPNGDIKIDPYISSNHNEACYYFCAAIRSDERCEDAARQILIPKHGFVNLWSVETFELSGRVLGLLGGLPDLILRGLQLIHPPSIDPRFKGAIALGIRNLTSSDIELHASEKVGKLLLFDVSDSMVGGQEVRDSVINVQKVSDVSATRKAGMRQYVNNVICRDNPDVLRVLERCSPSDLDDVRKLDPELRDAAILYALDKLHKGNSGDLGWLADRLAERGGAAGVLSDPDIHEIGDLEEKLYDYEVWRA